MPHPKTTQNELNELIGTRINTARKSKHLTLAKLANQIGVSYQQLQKYEKGHNRISACKLLHLAIILKVPVVWFYEDMEREKQLLKESIDRLFFKFEQ